MPKYTLPLSVATPEGKLIEAYVLSHKGVVVISVQYLKEVEIDNPSFAKDGVIMLKCSLTNYKETVIRLTKYIEHLFLKGMADESLYSSLGGRARSGRNKKQDIKGKVGESEGRVNSSLHSRTRRRKQTESSADRDVGENVLAEGSDTPISG